MQTQTVDTDPSAGDLEQSQAEIPQLTNQSPQQFNAEILDQLEQRLGELSNAFARLDVCKAEEDQLRSEAEKTRRAEAELLQDESLSESSATRKLVELRAKGYIQAARASSARARTSQQTEQLLELGLSLRRDLSRAAHNVLDIRVRRIQVLFDGLLPPGHGLPIDT